MPLGFQMIGAGASHLPACLSVCSAACFAAYHRFSKSDSEMRHLGCVGGHNTVSKFMHACTKSL